MESIQEVMCFCWPKAPLRLPDDVSALAEQQTSFSTYDNCRQILEHAIYTLMDPFAAHAIRYWAKRIQDAGVVPETEIFDQSMIGSVKKIHAEGLVSPPFSLSFCLGFENAVQPLPDNLFALKNALPPNSHWGLIHEDMEDFSLLAIAAGMGAALPRVGFEDSFQYRKGRLAPSNQVLVSEILELLDKLDLEPMPPAEARALLGVK